MNELRPNGFASRLASRAGSILGGLLLLSDCTHLAGVGGASPVQESSGVVQARQAAVSNSGDPDAASFFAEVAAEVSRRAEAETPPSPDNQRYAQTLSKEALGYLDEALARPAAPEVMAVLHARKGEMLLVQRDFTAADVAIRAGVQLCPSATTVEPMLRSLKLRDRAGEMAKWCVDARAQLCPRADLARLCTVCTEYGVEACNSPEDQDLMADKARQRVEAADAEQRRGTPSDPTVLRDAVVSMPIVNLCPRRVNLFFGQVPGGPGLVSGIDGKAKLSKRLQIHSKVWILDVQGNAVSSIIVKNEYPELTINPSGNGFR